jgi:hypothetical protein
VPHASQYMPRLHYALAATALAVILATAQLGASPIDEDRYLKVAIVTAALGLPINLGAGFAFSDPRARRLSGPRVAAFGAMHVIGGMSTVVALGALLAYLYQPSALVFLFCCLVVPPLIVDWLLPDRNWSEDSGDEESTRLDGPDGQ